MVEPTTQMKSPIFVALDVDNYQKAIAIAENVREFVGGFKVGPRLLIKYGPEIIKVLSDWGSVFVDNKYHDIPSTVVSAVSATLDSGATFVTVHASNGKDCLKQLSELEQEYSKKRFVKILAVTVLTSFENTSLPPNWKSQNVSDHVMDLASSAMEAGVTGLVCSGEELKTLRKRFPEAFIVTPGIRMPDGELNDQKRVLTPNLAIEEGASAIVVGRPIIEAINPRLAAKQFYDSLREVSDLRLQKD
jgi:orotidine-5'-phosphate decarboxylase